MVGSAIVAGPAGRGVTRRSSSHRASELDLADAARGRRVSFASRGRTYVFLAAAKVGGILANMESPVDFLDVNCRIALNVLAPRIDTACGSS